MTTEAARAAIAIKRAEDRAARKAAIPPALWAAAAAMFEHESTPGQDTKCGGGAVAGRMEFERLGPETQAAYIGATKAALREWALRTLRDSGADFSGLLDALGEAAGIGGGGPEGSASGE